MPRTLTARGEEMLEMLPPYAQADPVQRAVVDVQARELDRVDEFLLDLVEQFNPATATDEHGILSMLELLLGLPVAPSGVLEAARRATVVAFWRARKSSSGAGWVDLLSAALGTEQWAHEEGPGDYEITIHLPYSPGGYTVQTVTQLAEKITPAHLEVSATYSNSFIVGTTLVGSTL